MRSTMTKKRWLIAGCSLALAGLVVLAFSLGGSDTRPGPTFAAGDDPSTSSDQDSPDGAGPSADGNGDRSDDDADGAGVGGSSSKAEGSSPSGSDSDHGSTDDGRAQVDNDGDGDGILDEVGVVVDEILCTDEERAAIEATADDLKKDIFAAAEAEKDDLLDSLALGGLLGGITDAIQAELDAIDAEAEEAAAEVDSLVDDAIDLCEAGGEPLAIFE